MHRAGCLEAYSASLLGGFGKKDGVLPKLIFADPASGGRAAQAQKDAADTRNIPLLQSGLALHTLSLPHRRPSDKAPRVETDSFPRIPQPGFCQIDVPLNAPQHLIVDHAFIAQFQNHPPFGLERFVREALILPRK